MTDIFTMAEELESQRRVSLACWTPGEAVTVYHGEPRELATGYVVVVCGVPESVGDQTVARTFRRTMVRWIGKIDSERVMLDHGGPDGERAPRKPVEPEHRYVFFERLDAGRIVHVYAEGPR